MGRLIIDGNSVYEIDEECERQREYNEKRKQAQNRKPYGNDRKSEKKDQ